MTTQESTMESTIAPMIKAPIRVNRSLASRVLHWTPLTPLGHLLFILFVVLVAALLVVCITGCKASVDIGAQQPPSLVVQFVDTLAIDLARYGVTSQLAPRLERAYADGKMPYAVYRSGHDEEQAALDALTGLRSKVQLGQRVTAQELQDAEAKFVKPLQDLLDQYVPLNQLPATQPAR